MNLDYIFSLTLIVSVLIAHSDSVQINPGEQCLQGILLPVWEPQDNLSIIDRFTRGTTYFLLMLYMFIGGAIIADRFMGAIEVISSREKEIKIKKSNGEVQIVVVRVWNGN